MQATHAHLPPPTGRKAVLDPQARLEGHAGERLSYEEARCRSRARFSRSRSVRARPREARAPFPGDPQPLSMTTSALWARKQHNYNSMIQPGRF